MDLFGEFKEWLNNDEKCQHLWDKAVEKRANFQDADYYSIRVGNWWSKRLVEEYGTQDYSEFISEIEKSYKKSYSESAYYAKNVQKIVNEEAGIGMKPLEPAVDKSRLEHLITKLVDEDAAFLLGAEAVENFTRSAVTDTIQANARIHKKAGLHAYIERIGGAGCCSWCNSVSGKFEYGDEPDDFFRVHKGCTCHFKYTPSKGMVENFNYITKDGKLTKVVT